MTPNLSLTAQLMAAEAQSRKLHKAYHAALEAADLAATEWLEAERQESDIRQQIATQNSHFTAPITQTEKRV